MIREAKANDYWRTSHKTKKYQYIFNEISLKGQYGFNDIKIKKGIFAICGLNGAGKSTIISYIKDLIGIDKNENDILKVGESTCTASIEKLTDTILSNIDGNRLIDHISDSTLGTFIEYNDSLRTLNYLSQNNLEELLEQYETISFDKDDFQMIQYLVGKEYDKCSITVIEDDSDSSAYPYFSINTSSIKYDSLSMGLGEHYLFYLFWKLKSIDKSDIVIIEEPETFISIKSQEKLMNYIAKLASEQGVSFILTTHSPFILKKLEADNICVLSRYKDITSIHYYNDKTIILKKLGIDIPTKGILFFEDKLAESFFKSLSKYANITNVTGQYDLEITGSESDISERLKFKKTTNFKYKLIGIYDGDMKDKEEQFQKDNNWPFLFLPGDSCLEEDFRTIISKYIANLENMLDLQEGLLIAILSDLSGYEAHDWLNNLCDGIKKDFDQVVDKLTILWIEDNDGNKNSVNNFIENIQKVL